MFRCREKLVDVVKMAGNATPLNSTPHSYAKSCITAAHTVVLSQSDQSTANIQTKKWLEETSVTRRGRRTSRSKLLRYAILAHHVTV